MTAQIHLTTSITCGEVKDSCILCSAFQVKIEISEPLNLHEQI